MIEYLTRRIASTLLLMVAITAVAYGLIYSGGADVSRSILGELATDAQVAAKNAELGLDQPLPVQYGNWLAGALQGDLGRSWFSAERVSDAIATRLGVTLSVVTVAILLCTVISVSLGVFAAVKRGWWDKAVQVISVVGEALPNFWVGLLLVATFSISLRLFPATGFIPFSRSPAGWLSTVTLPVTALVIGAIAPAAAQVRGAVIDVMNRDYIRTLRARGLPEHRVIFGHALRNAASVAVTVLSLQLIGMIGGAVMDEKVFALPGMGTLAIDATVRGDIPVIMGVLITMALIVVVVNLLVDLANAWINPKARLT